MSRFKDGCLVAFFSELGVQIIGISDGDCNVRNLISLSTDAILSVLTVL